MRSGVSNANNATTTAANTGANLGGAAAGISGNLTPFLTSEMEHPQGFSQQDQSAMLSAAEGGAGGATSGLTGVAMPMAAASRNAAAFQPALAQAARERTKAAAGASEDIASQNARAKMAQQQQGSEGLQKLYGVDTSGMLDATGQESNDINAASNANKTGWLQNATGIMDSISNGIRAYKGH